MCGKAPYKLEWGIPTTNEKCELLLNDLSIALAYRDRYTEMGMQNVRVWSDWNQGYISPKNEDHTTNEPTGNNQEE
ncbi:MAG: hypothetical protein PHQ67_07265 [Fermentimonas sp.]|nr:hypothetical protein [Fermentimonas sp.]